MFLHALEHAGPVSYDNPEAFSNFSDYVKSEWSRVNKARKTMYDRQQKKFKNRKRVN